jgi:hypothetical protein
MKKDRQQEQNSWEIISEELLKRVQRIDPGTVQSTAVSDFVRDGLLYFELKELEDKKPSVKLWGSDEERERLSARIRNTEIRMAINDNRIVQNQDSTPGYAGEFDKTFKEFKKLYDAGGEDYYKGFIQRVHSILRKKITDGN